MNVNSDSPALPLAVLPGLMCDAALFDAFGEADPATIVVNGYYDGARTLPDMAVAALARLPDRFDLLGHSMGGRVALEIVRAAPQRVARLALASTGVHPVAQGEPAARQRLLDIARQQGMAAAVADWLPPMLAPHRRADAALVARLTAMCVAAGPVVLGAQIAALLSRPEVASLLPAIACPTLVITGSEDSWAPPEQHERIASAIPGANLVIVPGAGHMLPAEDPAALAAALAALRSRPA